MMLYVSRYVSNTSIDYICNARYDIFCSVEYLTCSGDGHLSTILELSILAVWSSFLFFLYRMKCITCSQVMNEVRPLHSLTIERGLT